MQVPGSALPHRALDRSWSTARVSTVLGPLRTASVDHLHSRWDEVLRQLPQRHWLRQHPGPFAVDLGDADVLGPVLELSREPWSGHALRAFVARGHVGLSYTHGIGDATTTRRLISDLLAPPGTPLRFPDVPHVRVGDLVGAAVRQWGRRPSGLLAAVRGVRTRTEPDAAGPTEIRPVLIRRHLDPHAQATVRARLDRERPGSSLSLALLGTVVAALDEHGVRPAQVALAVDVRRYLRGDQPTNGNVASPLKLSLSDPSPIDRRVRDAIAHGQPLAGYFASALRSRIVRRPRPDGGRAVSTLGWSDVRHVRGWDGLPWADTSTRVACSFTPPAGPRINVHINRVGDTLDVITLVNAAAFDPLRVEAAMDDALFPQPSGA